LRPAGEPGTLVPGSTPNPPAMGTEAPTPYQSEGDLNPLEAKRILPRLAELNVRFQIEADVGNHPNRSTAPINDARIRLFVHVDDLEAWRQIRREFFPV